MEQGNLAQGNPAAVPLVLSAHNGNLQLSAYQYIACHLQIELSGSGAMRTKGRIEIEGRLRQPFTAHPKLDPRTGGHAEGCSCLPWHT